jgi:hypothetical protein
VKHLTAPARRSVYRLVALFICALLASCDEWGSGSSSSTNVDPGGIWTGVDTVGGGEQMVGIVTEDGQANFIDQNGIQYVGTIDMSGDTFTVNIQGYAPFGSTFSDGSTHGTGTATGTITARQSISGTTTFTTDAGTTTTGALTLTFNALYNVPSSLATIAGSYTDQATGSVVTISSDGTIFSQNPATGCVINGTASIINASYNAYGFQIEYANCKGVYAKLNGIPLAGLGLFDNTASPAAIIAGGTSSSGGVNYGIAYELNQS